MMVDRIDYVIVCDKNARKSSRFDHIRRFIRYLESHNLRVEIKYGNIKDNIYINVMLTPEAIAHFSNLFDIDIRQDGHKYVRTSGTDVFRFNLFQTPLSNNRDIFKREGRITTSERIKIAHEILKNARFGRGETEYGLEKLIRLDVVKAAYPLHDGSYMNAEDKYDVFAAPKNDRQLLLKYWANFSVWYKEQPLNLIEKYYGTEVAFYFAWLGFYNRMLIPAAVVGLICSIISIVEVATFEPERVDDICTSKMLMCPLCYSHENCRFRPLNDSCYDAKVSIMFDNPATVFFAVFMSFWATLFISLWTRFENVLKLRWNVSFERTDTKTRLRYIERCTHKRMSKLTGKMQLYTPVREKAFYVTLSYATCLLLMGIVILFVCGVITYRLAMAAFIRMSDFAFLKLHANAFLIATSAILQVIFIKIFGTFYAQMAEWLTNLENPRTQSEFDDSVIHKRYLLGFTNNYASLFYIAFMKDRLYEPGDKPTVISFETDLCPPVGCLMPLCVQLAFLMLFKSSVGNILTLVTPKIKKVFLQRIVVQVQDEPQWENEYKLKPAGRYLLTSEFMEMIIQYGFVTFFVAAFPLAPLCALINNCIELRLDAYKLVTRYRRPKPRQQSGIGTWNNILKLITHLSVATNAFVLAFTSDFVVRQIYYSRHHTLDGYINSTLSLYDMRDSEAFLGTTLMNKTRDSMLCYYKAVRYPPDHPNKYALTPDFWYQLGMRLACVIAFEHTIMVTNGIVAYFIPNVPVTVKQFLHHEKTKELELKLKIKHDGARKTRNRMAQGISRAGNRNVNV